ncbi:MAG: hypothetical protein IPK82_28550 [Polyangiaceae bacterium]|nr:hypothetical protein [Polyangiaceae bacterium]
MLNACSVYTDLAFHALAFIPPAQDASGVARASSIHRPAWIQAAREHFNPQSYWPFEEDAALLSRLCANPESALAVQQLPFLHADIPSFLKAARFDIHSLADGDVHMPSLLHEMRRAPREAIEILRADMALSARAFAREHAEHLGPFVDRFCVHNALDFDQIAQQLPAFSNVDIFVSATLGPHGRALNRSVVTGINLSPWVENDAQDTCFWGRVAHEISVIAALAKAPDASWAELERTALDAGEIAFFNSIVYNSYSNWRATIREDSLPKKPAGANLTTAVAQCLRAGRW